MVERQEDEILVLYKWTAKPGKLEELRAIYDEVYQSMKEHEKDTLKMDYYFSEEENAIIVHDLFKNSEGLAYHLTNTAGTHFPKLLEIAIPGSFYFCGNVPDHLKQATQQMGLAAEFYGHAVGFDNR